MGQRTSPNRWSMTALSLLALLALCTAVAAETISLDANYAAPSLVINPTDTFITNGYDVDIGTGGITIKSGGILDANSGAGGDSLITLEGDWGNSGSFDPGSSTVTFDGAGSQTITTGGADPNRMFNNLTISGPNIALAGFVQLSGDFVIEKVTDTFSTGGHDVNIAGDWTNNGTFDHDGSTVTFNGLSPQIIITGGTDPNKTFNNVKVSGVGVELELFGQTLAGDFVFESTGTSSTGGHDVNIAGSLIINSGTLDANGSNISLGGDWTNNDTFTPGGGTVILDGATNQTISGSETFYGLTIDKSGGSLEITDGTTVTVGGAFTIAGMTPTITGTSTAGYGLTLNGDINVPAANINYANPVEIGGSGSVTFNNAAFGNFIDSPGSKFLYVTRISMTATFDGCSFSPGPNGSDRYNVQPNASGSIIEFTNWSGAGAGEDYDFDGDPDEDGHITWVYFKRWTGSMSSLWSIGANWSPSGVPDSSADVCIPDGSPYDPLLDVPGYCLNMNILPGGTLNGGVGQTLNVSGDWTNNDTFSPGTSTVRFAGPGHSTIAGSNATTFHDLEVEKTDVSHSLFITTDGCGSSNKTSVNCGTLDFSNADVTFTCANDIEFSGGGLSSRLTLDVGDMLVLQGNFAFRSSSTENITGGTMYIAEDFYVEGGADFTPATGGPILFDGSSPSSIDLDELSAYLPDLTIEKTGGAAVTAGTDIAVKGNLTINSGQLDANGHDLSVAGDWTNNDTFTPGGGTVIFDGAGSQTISPGDSTFNHLRIDGAADLTVTLGGFMELSGDFVIEKVTDTFSTGGNPIKVAASWVNNGTFNHDGGTVTLDGSGTFGPGSDPFDDLIVSSGTRTLTGPDLKVDGKLTVTSTGTLQATTGGLDIYTGEGGDTDVDIDGSLILQLAGATGDINWYVRKNSLVDVDPCATVILDGFDNSNRIRLQSSTDRTEWSIVDHTTDTNTPSINNVTVKDCDASSGNTIYADDGTNTNAGGNVNWLFNTTNIIYVDDDASGNNDGSSWTHAYNYLQDALADANTSGKGIWVAAGSYKPDVNTSNAPGTGDRQATFALTNGLTMCGGFPSGGGTWEDRDPNAYKAILTGDLDGNDIGQPNHPTRGENSYHAVTCVNSVTLDGFTITGGNANGLGFDLYGAGIFCPNAPTLMPNIIVNNTITGNAAGTDSMDGYGAGVAIYDSETFFLLNSIEDCFTIRGRGTMLTVESSGTSPWDSTTRIKNNTITGGSGGAGPCFGGGIAVINNSSSQITITGNIISNNQADYGGGIYCEGSSLSPPLIINNNFISNNFADGGGGVYSDSSDIQLVNCIIQNNEADFDGGGVLAEPNATFNATNCQFLGNTATSGNGGGVAIDPNGSFTATNCVFTGNSATTGDGGGFYADSNATFTATNCTFAGNSAANLGGGGRHLLGNPFNNVIFWANTDSTGSGESAQISGAAPIVSHSCIQGWTGSGPGNISVDPFLADIPDQVRLLSTSPCRDAGDDSSVPPDTADLDNDGDTLEPTPFDLDARPRFADGDCGGVSTVDMGAYEFSSAYLGDFDGDCNIDFFDFAEFGPAWSTQTGDSQFDTTFDISLPADNSIDMLDFDIFAENWLITVPYKTLHSAVIVGISDYNDIPDVNFGAEDANDWYSYFAGLGYEHIWVYGDNNTGAYPRYDGLATEANIKAALQDMVNNTEADDVIAFVFSGHGDGDGVGNSWLCAWDSNSGMSGEDGDLWDHEFAAILQSAPCQVFIFLDSCLSGGMGDELMAMPNAANVYATTSCDPNGCRLEEPVYSNGAWTYWFLEDSLTDHFGSDPDTTMEECFAYADAQYNPGGDDEPMEFDGDPGSTFTLW